MPTVEIDGTKLYYEEAGDGDPAMVFVHGWTCNHTHFAPQFDHFSAGHRVVAVDLRGHGQSDQPEQEYTIAGFADDVAAVCGELGLQRPVVIGHSMGAITALELAARHPDLPGAIVMVDAAPIVMTPELAGLLVGVGEAMTGPGHDAARRGFMDMLFIESDDPSRRAAIAEQMLSTADYVATSCLMALAAWDGEAAARACGVPALHIAAADPINDSAALRALNPLIRTGQTVGAGHFNQLFAHAQVNAMIEQFLATSLPT